MWSRRKPCCRNNLLRGDGYVTRLSPASRGLQLALLVPPAGRTGVSWWCWPLAEVRFTPSSLRPWSLLRVLSRDEMWRRYRSAGILHEPLDRSLDGSCPAPVPSASRGLGGFSGCLVEEPFGGGGSCDRVLTLASPWRHLWGRREQDAKGRTCPCLSPLCREPAASVTCETSVSLPAPE